LILCCTAPAWDYGDEIDRNAAARGIPRALAARERDRDKPIESDEAMRRHWVDTQPLYFHRIDPQVIAAMDAGMIYSAAAYNLSEILLADFDLSPRLTEITVPTLVIAGRDDWVTPPSQADRMMAALPDAKLAIFEESGHYPFVEEHELFIGTVRQWVIGLG
jgi:proline iminopeptidase